MAKRIGNVQTPDYSGVSDIINLRQHKNYVEQDIFPTPDNDVLSGLRFDGSSYLSRTFGSGNRKTWTWSSWIKRSRLNVYADTIFSAGTVITGVKSTTDIRIDASGDNYLYFDIAGFGNLRNEGVLRDTSSWYHVLVTLDTTSSKVKFYINGNLENNTGSLSIGLNEEYLFNNNTTHYIGHMVRASYYFNGYLANIHFIDGQALDPSYFGYSDRETGQWKPKKYSGTYGGNGFYLPLNDGRSFTPGELTNDSSDVYLLLKSNGSDGSGTFVDDTTNSTRTATTISKQNTPTHTTEVAGKYQSTTMKFTYDNYLYVLNSSPNRDNIHNSNSLYTCYEFWAKFTGDMTQDCSIYFVYSYTGDYHNPYWGKEGNTTGYIRSYYQNNGGSNGIWSKTDANYFGKVYNYPYFLTDGEWHHYAYEQHKNELEVCYIDGYVSAVLPMSGASWADTNASVTLCRINHNNGHTMYVDSFRITQSTTPRYAAGVRDDSGNKNHWTLLQGRSYGQIDAPTTLNLKDSPQNTFSTLNPLYKSLGGTPTLTDGNLKAAPNIVQYHTATSTIGVSSGKWYCEILCLGSPNSANYFGVGDIAELNALSTTQTVIGYSSQGHSIDLQNGTYSRTNDTNSLLSTSLGAFGNGDIFNIHMDLDNGNLYFGKNGTYANGGSPVATGLDGTFFIALTMYTNGFSGAVLNTGQDPTFAGNKTNTTTYTDANGIGSFYYEPPEGALALCTRNLPNPDIAKPEEYFNPVIYAGDLNNNTHIECGFSPDLVWIKNRGGGADGVSNNMLFNSLSGPLNYLSSDKTDQELSNVNGLQEFTNTGFRPGSMTRTNETNYNYVAWCWKAGGAPSGDGVAMVDGSATTCSALATSAGASITPTRMSVNTKAGFSIVKYGGSNTTGLLSSSVSSATIPHGLNNCEFSIIKNIKWSNTWVVSHSSIAPNVMSLQVTGAANSTPPVDPTYGQITTLGSNTVTITRGTSRGDNVGEDYDAGGGQFEYIMYCWHSVAGYSKFGSYEGASEVFVNLGFRPAFVMVKCINAPTSNQSYYSWTMCDSSRTPYNGVTVPLYANYSKIEGQRAGDTNTFPTDGIDFLSNGFRILSPNYGELNVGAGYNYLYAAFAEQPIGFTNSR